MGRPSTGAQTTDTALDIDIRVLREIGLLRPNQIVSYHLKWRCRGEVSASVFVTVDTIAAQMIIAYTITQDDEKTEVEQLVELTSIPSNLGKGRIWYFVCPASGERCKVIYCAYGYTYFKSRKAYETRLYYQSQIDSKLDYHNERFFDVDKRITALENKSHWHDYHKGRPTKAKIHLEKLKAKREWLDLKRWEEIHKYL